MPPQTGLKSAPVMKISMCVCRNYSNLANYFKNVSFI